MPTYTDFLELYKPDLGQKSPSEWGTSFNENLDKIDRLIHYKNGIPLWGTPFNTINQFILDDEFDGETSSSWNIDDDGSNTIYYNVDTNFGRLILSKQPGSAPDLAYYYQNNNGGYIDHNNYTEYTFTSLFTFHIPQHDADIGGGLFVNSLDDDYEYKLRLYFPNGVSLYEYGQAFSYSLGNLVNSIDCNLHTRFIFLRIISTWNNSSSEWELKFRYSYDGLHWLGVNEYGSLSTIDNFGFFIENANASDVSNSQLISYWFRINYNLNYENYKE